MVKRITDNKIIPLVIYLCDSPIPDKATRKFAAEQLPNVYSAMAMISKPGLAKLIMHMVFMLKPPSIPTKAFTNDERAKAWLKQYL